MTSEEKQEIINAVLAALRTNSKTIGQLTPVSEMSEEDFLELNGGRKVSYGVLFANHMSNDEANEGFGYLDTKKVDKDQRGLVEVHQAPVVFLDAMGTLDGHSLNGGEGLEYRSDYKQIHDFPGGETGAPKQGAVYISKNNFKKFVWNGTDMEELKADECPLFVDYMVPVSFATLPVGGSYYVPSSHKIAVKIDASNTKTYDPLPDALYFFRDKGKVYTWNSSTNNWVPVSSDIKVVNDCITGGEGDALSAEMGKKIRQNVTILLNRLGEYAFPNGKPTLDWSGGGGDDPEVPTYAVQKTIGTGLSSTGGDTDVALGDSLEVSIAITDNLYIIDDDNVEVTMDGSPVAGAWNASTMKVTIAAVTGNVVINVPSLTYVGYGESNSPLVSMFDGKNRGGTTGQWKDAIETSRFLDLQNCTEATDHVEFNGTTSTAFVGSSVPSSLKRVDVLPTVGTIESVSYLGLNSNGTWKTIFSNGYDADNYRIVTSLLYSNNNIVIGYSTKLNSEPTGQTNSPAKGYNANVASIGNCYLSLSYARATLNGVSLSKTTDFTGIKSVTNQKLGVFADYNASNALRYSSGKLYCLRIYSRQLSVDEIAQNFKVDQKRFNLT